MTLGKDLTWSEAIRTAVELKETVSGGLLVPVVILHVGAHIISAIERLNESVERVREAVRNSSPGGDRGHHR